MIVAQAIFGSGDFEIVASPSGRPGFTQLILQSEAGMVKACDAAEAPFDFDAGAELFVAHRRRSAEYLRFDRAADAIRFAIEELPPQSLLAAHLEVEEGRFGGRDIRRLYDGADFPLARRGTA
jgi:hypothetical protein